MDNRECLPLQYGKWKNSYTRHRCDNISRIVRTNTQSKSKWKVDVVAAIKRIAYSCETWRIKSQAFEESGIEAFEFHSNHQNTPAKYENEENTI